MGSTDLVARLTISGPGSSVAASVNFDAYGVSQEVGGNPPSTSAGDVAIGVTIRDGGGAVLMSAPVGWSFSATTGTVVQNSLSTIPAVLPTGVDLFMEVTKGIVQ